MPVARAVVCAPSPISPYGQGGSGETPWRPPGALQRCAMMHAHAEGYRCQAPIPFSTQAIAHTHAHQMWCPITIPLTLSLILAQVLLLPTLPGPLTPSQHLHPPHTPLPSPAGKHTLIQLSVCLVHTVVIQLSFSFHSVPPTLMPLAHLIRFRQEFFAEGAAGLNRSRLPLPGPPIFPISSFYLSVTIYT
jgi:hypothetical protein